MARAILMLCFLVSPLLLGGSAVAQVPPHYPGTICFTPQFWCWLQYAQHPGSTCFCMTQYGPIRGVAG